MQLGMAIRVWVSVPAGYPTRQGRVWAFTHAQDLYPTQAKVGMDTGIFFPPVGNPSDTQNYVMFLFLA
jgi:hypothetical protein